MLSLQENSAKTYNRTKVHTFAIRTSQPTDQKLQKSALYPLQNLKSAQLLTLDEKRATTNIRFKLCPGDVVLVLEWFLITLVLGRQ